MGLSRFLKKVLIPGYYQYKVVKKVSENGIVNGVKEELKEDFLDDIPIISHIYDAGKNDGYIDGKEEGYVQASNEYEQKLLKQAEKFENEKGNVKKSIDEYKKLLNEYEKYISLQEQHIEQLSQEKLLLLCQVKEKYNVLKKLKE